MGIIKRLGNLRDLLETPSKAAKRRAGHSNSKKKTFFEKFPAPLFQHGICTWKGTLSSLCSIIKHHSTQKMQVTGKKTLTDRSKQTEDGLGIEVSHKEVTLWSMLPRHRLYSELLAYKSTLSKLLLSSKLFCNTTATKW